MEEIVIEIGPDGSVTVEGKGFEGTDCTALTRELEAALGDVQKRTLKPEYHRVRKVVRKAGA